jgi:GGDEF domain-containing protein
VAGQTTVIGVSSGITLCPLDVGMPDGLLNHADQAMYLAKQHGRNCYEFFELG